MFWSVVKRVQLSLMLVFVFFSLVVAPALAAPGFRQPPGSPYPAVPESQALTLADLDGREGLDLVTAGSTASVRLNNGDGSYGGARTLSVSFGGRTYSQTSVTSADFNADGRADLAFRTAGRQVLVLPGEGDGTFGEARSFSLTGNAASTNIQSLAVGDFNGDGRPDLAATSTLNVTAENRLTVLTNATLPGGAIDFTRRDLSAADLPFALASGDFNGDRFDDLTLVTSATPGVIKVLLGDGLGGFREAASLTTSANTLRHVDAGDYSGDGLDDVAAVDSVSNGPGSVLVALNAGEGSLLQPTRYGAGVTPRSVASADFGGDGRLDLAVAGASAQERRSGVFLLDGSGRGDFSSPTFVALGSPDVPVRGISAAGIDPGPRPDLALASSAPDAAASSVYVLLNTAPPPAPPSPDLEAGSDTGASSTDNTTADTTPTFTGIAPPNSMVRLYAGDLPLGSTKADGSGRYLFTTPQDAALPEGENPVAATVSEGASAESARSEPLKVLVDVTPPSVEVPEPEEGAVLKAPVRPRATASDWSGVSGVRFEGEGVPGGSSTDTEAPYETEYDASGDGPREIRVTATDRAGNEAEVSRSFTLDNTAPDTEVDSGPEGFTKDDSPEFTFSASESEASFECRLYRADAPGTGRPDFAACASTKGYGGLEEGEYTFEVRALDGVGNADGSPASRTFTVDTTPPAVEISAPAEGASYERGVPARAEYLCSDAGAGISSCAGPVEDGEELDTATSGERVFTVRAEDRAGNVSTVTRRYTVADGSAPETEILSGPEGATRDARPTFTFSGTDGAAPERPLEFSYRLNGGGWSAYSQERSATLGGREGLPDGEYVFEVRARDAAGNVDAAPASRRFVLSAGEETSGGDAPPARNNPPEGRDDKATTEEDPPGPLRVDVLANDADPDGDALTVLRVSDPKNGTARVAESGGAVHYIPERDYASDPGEPDEFTYTVCDDRGGERLCARATVAVTVTRVNDAPVARNDTARTAEDRLARIEVLANDADPDGDRLALSVAKRPKNGAVRVGPDGSILYRPERDYRGRDAFAYRVSDGEGGTATARVEVVVGERNDAPVARDDHARTRQGRTVVIDVLANDYDPDGDRLAVSEVGISGNGRLYLGRDGRVRFTPAQGFTGTATFTYRATDGKTASNRATVRIRVRE
ncbi:Family description [Rubrobacter radiotolerans]|uniref:Family description n=1 Tax=Rubrobacter radiotolerans TaxID=42256 RepID=A0A023WYN7_RUBRA|nr:tandem-95 repeat protein [Rubrobacter radiotolerans]AHY45342.1 Family description [Rubrobacter radiotolerans]MDX5892753.1 tandem-95 repeat protein [Rubrobacter radiotolerans]SMC02422.1 Ig-like domain (group 3) [Rubrobacter radiotolerans DSM 5868]